MITIRQGSFEARILLCEVENLSLVKLRKLLKLAFSSCEENLSALREMESWINAEAGSRKESWRQASEEVFRCAPTDRKRCTRDLKKAKASYDRLMHIKSIFEKEKGV